MARRKRHTPEQVVRKLTQADRMRAEGQEVPDVCRELRVSEQTYYRLRNQFGGLKANDTKRLKDLERENATPKRLLADAELEKAALQEIARETFKPAAQAGSRASPHRGDECQRAVRLSGHRTAPHHPASPATQPNADRPDAALREWLRQWAHDHPRWGFRRAYHAARAEAGMSTTYACSDSSARRACGCRSVAAATPRLQHHHHHHDRRRPTGCGRWTYAWLRDGSLVTYFPRAAFRWAEDTALRWVRSDATEAKV
jgi:putative transposase